MLAGVVLGGPKKITNDPGQELSGGLPETTFRGEIGHFLPDPSQELPGGFPETTFTGEIGHFLPDPGQELPRRRPRDYVYR